MNYKIVLAEDNPTQANIILLSLEDKGYEIIWEKDGESALNSIKTQLPDLVILDIIMPVMDGYQVLEKIKADENTRHIPIIILTAKDLSVDLIKGRRLGADDYIVKPYNPNLLEESIKLLLNKKGSET